MEQRVCRAVRPLPLNRRRHRRRRLTHMRNRFVSHEPSTCLAASSPPPPPQRTTKRTPKRETTPLLSSPLHVHSTEVALHDSDIHCDRVTPSIWRKMPLRDPVAFENGKSAASRQFLRTHRVSHSYCRTQHSTRDSIGEEEDHNGEEKPLAWFVFVVRAGGLGTW